MCAPCKHKQAMAAKKAMQSSPSFVVSQARTLENVEFLQLYYIGPEDVVITSQVPNVSYGTKSYGSHMYVATVDFNANPELWTENEPTNNNNTN